MNSSTRALARLARLAVLAGLLVAIPLTARAQQAPDVSTQAKASYELGMTAYWLGHYDRAIEAFSRAHALDPAPILLHNIAQAYWKKGDNERAVAFYRQYLEADPKARNRSKIRARIRELEKTPPARKHMPPPEKEPSVTTPPPAAAESTETIPPSTTSGDDPANAPDPPHPVVQQPASLTVTPPPLPAVSLVEPNLRAASGPGEPVYRRPWFWPAVGAATLLTVAAIFLIRPDRPGWSCGPECQTTRVVP